MKYGTLSCASRRLARFWASLAVGSSLSGCGSAACPEGTVESGGVCVVPNDAAAPVDGGDLDAGPLDAFVPGEDAPLPDVFVPMGVDAGELPDVFLRMPDAFVAPDACTPVTFFVDADGDGHGDPAMSAMGCAVPMGSVVLGDDCNDASMSIHPGATEACDGVDQDCDSRFDEGSGPIAAFHVDADGDGHGAIGGASVMACAAPPGRAAVADDCDDTAMTRFPGASELCNAVDEDCDGGVDESIQRLLRTPHEIVPAGGASMELVAAAAVGDAYAVTYATPSGWFIRRVSRDGTAMGSARSLPTTQFPTLVATGPTRAAVLFGRLVSGVTYSNHAISVDFATEPPTLGSEVSVASSTRTFTPSAFVVGDRVLVLWLDAFGRQARTFALDLSGPSAPSTLATFSMSGATPLSGAGGTTWLAYSATRPGTSRDECYAQRLDLSSLTLDPTIITLGDGSGECFAFTASTGVGTAQQLISYAGGASFEHVWWTLDSTVTVVRRARATLVMPFGTAFPGHTGSTAGADFAYASAPGSPAVLGQWQHTAYSGPRAPSASFGGAQDLSNLAIARRSSQHGAMFYVATPTGGGSSHALWMQEIGCE